MKPYILCEPFAGSAGLTYRMLGGKPPISYIGSKANYAQTMNREPAYRPHRRQMGLFPQEQS